MMINKRFTALILGLTFVVSCSSTPTAPAPERSIVVEGLRPGVVQYVWEEPVVDVIDVPPGLDPDGVYYRPAHQQVVEIRQGRWQYYQDSKGIDSEVNSSEDVSTGN